MKKLAVVLGVLLTAAFLGAALPGNNQVSAAVSGCCKERDSEKHPWRPLVGVSFETCQQLNQADVPEDNIFQKAGRFWWDVGC